MKMDGFPSWYTVFHVEELDRFPSDRGADNLNTRRSLLAYHRKPGRIIPIRRGLHGPAPVGGDPASSPASPYLRVAKLTPDAELRATTLEKTLVDVLDWPDLTCSWEGIWRSLESVEFIDLEQVIAYVCLLENGTTAAKVVFFLEHHKTALRVEDVHLDPLKKLLPRQPPISRTASVITAGGLERGIG